MNKFLGKGINGSCYLDEETGEVIKIYNNSLILDSIPSEFVGLYNSTYVFPKRMILDPNTGKRVATVFRYIDSLSLDKKDIDIDDIINSIDKCYNDTDKISKQEIVTFDVFPKNMLYDDSIKIIDIDYYNIGDLKDYNLIKLRNITTLNKGLGVLFFDIFSDLPNLINGNPVLKELFYQCFTLNNDNRTLKEFLLHLKKIVQEQEQKEIKMASEFRKILSK